MTPQSSQRHLGRACWLEDSPCWDEVGIAETVLAQERVDLPSMCPSGRLGRRPSYRRRRAQGTLRRARELVTIILSLLTRHYALQASDRLLALKKGNRYEPWDPASNKSV